MTNEDKAMAYNRLMSEYTMVENQINALKGENLDPTPQTQQKIRELNVMRERIMTQVTRLMS
jgi:hypothetical protein